MTTQRSNCWSITINNPTKDDEEQINLARQRGWKVEGQLEKGDEGTPHYQLRVMTPQVRFSAVKKAFPRGHIEAARDPVALGKYVSKEATKLAELPTGQAAYPSLSRFWELIYLHYNTDDRYGFDSCSLEENDVRFYSEELDDEWTALPLGFLDRATRSLIVQGYHVESLAANPSTRSMWKLYSRELMARSHTSAKEAVPNTLETEDRQTDSVNSEQEIVVPTNIPNAPHVWTPACFCPPPPPHPSSSCSCAPPPPQLQSAGAGLPD